MPVACTAFLILAVFAGRLLPLAGEGLDLGFRVPGFGFRFKTYTPQTKDGSPCRAPWGLPCLSWVGYVAGFLVEGFCFLRSRFVLFGVFKCLRFTPKSSRFGLVLQ